MASDIPSDDTKKPTTKLVKKILDVMRRKSSEEGNFFFSKLFPSNTEQSPPSSTEIKKPKP